MKALVAALLLCVACGGASRGAPREGGGAADTLAGRRVRKVNVTGNHAFDDREIVAYLAHRPRKGLPLLRKYTRYDPLALRVDVNRVEAFYRERGFFAASADVSVRPVRGNQIDVEFEVDEGPPTKLVAVEVRGAPAEARAAVDELVEESDLRKGARVSHVSYLELKESIVSALVRRGYAHAEVRGELEVDLERGEAAIDLEIDPGPLVRFGNVAVSGNKRIPTEVILRRLAWQSGDRFDPAKIRLTRRRLASLGVFGAIRIGYSRVGRPEWIETEVVVTEAKRHEIKLGGGFGADNSRYEIRARAGYSIKSWLHPLVNLRMDARIGYAVYDDDTERAVIGEGEVAVERQDLIVPRLRVGLAALLERDAFEAYEIFGPGARVTIDRPFGRADRIFAGVGWQIRYLDIDSDINLIEDTLDLRGLYRLAFFEQSISYDGRDDRFVPRRGVFVDLRAEQGGGFSGSAFAYLRLTPDARLYLPLGPLVVATRARIGLLDSLDEGPTPVTRRYFGGGSTSHRGFGFRQLSPTIANVPVGGDAILETSAELRFPLPWDSFRGVLFLDGGDVTRTFSDIDTGDLAWATGVGLRIDTVVGPARLDIAYRINRYDGDDKLELDRFRFHLSLGEAF